MKVNLLKRTVSIFLSFIMIFLTTSVAISGSAQEIEELIVDGNKYQIGDTFKLTANLKTLRWIINGQLDLYYDRTKLKCIGTSFDYLTDNDVDFYENNDVANGHVHFNFSEISGVNFTNENILFEYEFEVIGQGTTSIVNNIDIKVLGMFDYDGPPLSSNNYDYANIGLGKNGIDKNSGTLTYVFSEPITPEEPTTEQTDPTEPIEPEEGILIVDGNRYEVGDTFKLTANLKTLRWIVNGQMDLYYDSTKLNCTSVSYDYLKNNGIGVVYNNNHDKSLVHFNFSDLRGVDFTNENVLFEYEFEVIDDGITSLEDNLDVVALGMFDSEGSPETSGSYDYTNIGLGKNGIDKNSGALTYVFSEPITPEEPTTEPTEPTETTEPIEPEEGILIVDGNRYEVGDTFKLTANLKTLRWIVNGQMDLYYDSTKLNCTSVSYDYLKNNGIGVVYNNNHDKSLVHFNFSDLRGVDFTNENVLFEYEFEVIDDGITSLEDNLDVVALGMFDSEGSPETSGSYDYTNIGLGKNGIDKNSGTLTYVFSKPIIPEDPDEKILTIDGNSYEVGDVFRYTVSLETLRWIINSQIEFDYDKTKLICKDISFEYLENQGVNIFKNSDIENGSIKFNFSELKGIDFTKENEFFTFEFEVIDSGQTSFEDSLNVVVLGMLDNDGSPEGGSYEYTDIALGKDGINENYGHLSFVFSEPIVPDPEEGILIVDGNRYEVGDTFKLTANLKTLRWIINGQMDLHYDSTKLNCINVSYDYLEKNGVNVVYNNNHDESLVHFNFSVLYGIDFTNENSLFTYEFEVIDDGITSIEDNLDVVALGMFDADGSPTVPETYFNGGILNYKNIGLGENGIDINYGKIEYVYTDGNTSEKNITVNDVQAKEGDTIEYTIYLENKNNCLIDNQTEIKYSNEYLEFVDAKFDYIDNDVSFAENNIVESGEVDSLGNPAGLYLFNFTAVKNGVDFTSERALVKILFRVKRNISDEAILSGKALIESNIVESHSFGSSKSIINIPSLNRFNMIKIIEDNNIIDPENTSLRTKVRNINNPNYWDLLDRFYNEWKSFDTTGYTEDTVSALNAALERAKIVLDNIEAGNYDEYPYSVAMGAANKLFSSFNLVPDKTELKNIIDSLKQFDTSGYTLESIDIFIAEIEKAENVLSQSDASLSEINEAILIANGAKNFLRADTTELIEKIVEAEDFASQEGLPSDYLEEINSIISEAYDMVSTAESEFVPLEDIIEVIEKIDNILNTDDTKPEAISNFIAIGDTNRIVLSWSISHEVDTKKYNIYRKAENEEEYVLIKSINDRNTLTYTDTDVKNNCRYYYYIVGVNLFGTEGNISVIATSVPEIDTEKPRIIRVTPSNNSFINGVTNILVQADDNIQVVKTELYISLDDEENWIVAASENANSCSYDIDTSVYDGDKIKIKAVAYDAAGNSSDNCVYEYHIDNIGPSKVNNVSYESTSNTITLRWNNVPDEDFSFFRVEKMNSDGSFEKFKDIYDTLGVNIFDLQPDTEYSFRVVAYDRLGNRGVESDIVTAITSSDETAPVITLIKPDSDYFSDVIPVEITAEDNTNIKSITLQFSLNKISWEDYAVLEFSGENKIETASFDFLLNDYPEGNIYLRGIATDIYENSSNSSYDSPYNEYIIDKSAPQKPQNIFAKAMTGAIEISWDMGQENDIERYILYRSTDRQEYKIISDNLKSVNYIDRSVEKGENYYYRLAVADRAGNISDFTDVVYASPLVDTIPPTINSISLESGSYIGPSNNNFGILVSDNWKVKNIKVIYWLNDEKEERILINNEYDDYFVTLNEKIPISEFESGDILHFKIVVIDAQGLETTKDDIIYRIDKEAPIINEVIAESDEQKIILKWIGNNEEDLAGYRIYRKSKSSSYKLVAQRSNDNCFDYIYEDSNVIYDETYKYKIEAIDIYGNSTSLESEEVCVTIEPFVHASLICEPVQEIGVEYYFDATNCETDSIIKSYEFDFGDGTVVTGENSKVVHKYDTLGTYTVTLTVVDINNNSDKISQTVTVQDPSLLGKVKVKVIDAAGNALIGIPVYFDLDNTSENIKYTDSNGYVTFIGESGKYAVGSYEDGYLPIKKYIVIGNGATTDLVLQMIEEPIVTGNFEVNRMTLDEIIAAGIDISDPANQNVVKINFRIVYGTQPVTFDMITNGDKIYSGGTVIVDTDEGKRELSAVNVTAKNPGASGSIDDILGGNNGDYIIAIMDIPVEASYLKEFFDVKLHIINNAQSNFELKNNSVKLNVPDGMSIINTNNSESSDYVEFDPLMGQQQKTIKWILRGDSAGEYNLEAEYNGTLSEFEVPVSAKFITDNPIKVYGTDAIKIIADINKNVMYGGFYFNIALENISDTDIYLPTLDVQGNIISVFEGMADKDMSLKILGNEIENSSGQVSYLDTVEEIDTLASGEKIRKKYVCYNAISSEDIAYLRDAIYTVADDLDIEVEINETDIELYSTDNAAEKVESIFSDAYKLSLYHYMVSDYNFLYYQQALDDDKFWSNLGHSFYVSTDMVLNLDWDLFTHETEREITRQYIVEMLQDESFAYAVNAKIDNTYLTTAKNTLSKIEDLLDNGYSSVSMPQDVLNDIKEILKTPDNVKSLATSLKEGGNLSFTEKLAKIIGASLGKAVVEQFKYICKDSIVIETVSSELKEGLGYVSESIDSLTKVFDVWNESVDITNQLVTINAAQSEALDLFDIILSNKTIESTKVHEEVETLKEGLINGFETQQKIFADEIGSMLIHDLTKFEIDSIIGCIDAIYFTDAPYGVGTVITTLRLVFNLADELFGWEETANVFTSLRVAGLITLSLSEATLDYENTPGYEQEFLKSLKYLIKSRLVGEKLYVNLISDYTGSDSDYQGDKILELINKYSDAKYASIDDYYTAYKEKMLTYRDILFEEMTTSYTRPEAPNVSINYLNETTNEVFGPEYEYSFDGVNWNDCNNSVISLNPGKIAKTLWIRVKETQENLSGNILKVYIPARISIDKNITVKYKSGIYYIDGLSSKCYYNMVDEKIDSMICDKYFIATEGQTVTINNNDGYHQYVALVLPETENSFKSGVYNAVVEKANVIDIVYDNSKGSITGFGEYFTGEKVILNAAANDGYEFDGWYVNGSLVSTEPTYEFEADRDITYEAVFKEIPEVSVVFKGWNNEILSEKTYSSEITSSEEIIVPEPIIITGYDFVGWRLNNVLYSDEEIAEAVFGLLKTTTEITVKAELQQKDELYHVTIENGTLENGKTEGDFKPSTLLKVTANEAESGKKFAYWKRDGIIVSYSEQYSFFMPMSDVNVVAIYEDEESEIEAVGTTYMESVTKDPENSKLIFVSVGTVPEGATMECSGIVATSDSSKATGSAELTSANADYVRGGAGYKNCRYTWTKTKVTPDQTWYVRSYLKYRDVNGQVKEIYGDLVTVSFGATVTFKGWNNEILSEKTYSSEITSSEEIIVPEPIIITGYDFVGWRLNNVLYSDEEIAEAVFGLLKTTTEITVKAELQQKDELYHVTIENGTLENGKTEGDFKPSTLLKVTANEAESGKKFAYWKRDGIIVSYSEQYSFFMPMSDVNVVAIYEDEESEIEAVGTTYMESVTKDPENSKLIFVSVGTVPEGATMECSGIVATSDSSKATGSAELTSANADYVRGGAGYKNCRYTWTKTKVTPDQTWYVRSYLKYIDVNGQVKEVYGDLVVVDIA